MDWKELMSLFYSKFYPLHEIHQDRNYIYNFCLRDGESIAQAWVRLKSLMLKCPNHELSNEIIVNNFMQGYHVMIKKCLMLLLLALLQARR